MSIRAMKDYTFAAKYASWLPKEQRRETWSESVDRVKGMMLVRYKDKIDESPELENQINFAYDMMRKKKVLGSQRALQFGGEPTLKKNLRIFNCLTSFANRELFFQECMYALLCGCGVGFSVQKHHVKQLPKLSITKDGTKKYVIEDSIEGWADSVGVLVCSYFEKSEVWPEYASKKVSFDYTKIRDKGASISSGGKAPGPEPLKEAHRRIRSILDNAIQNCEFTSTKLKKLRPIEVYDIIMHFADAVLAGGVRRSATIAIFSKDDKDMLKAKTGNWMATNPQRGRSNNSVLLIRGETTWEEFSEIINSVKEYGEPGFVWADSTEIGFNPCFQKDTRLSTENGLIKIEDLYKMGGSNRVVVDKRCGKGDVFYGSEKGIQILDATQVELTQQNAEIFELSTEHGYSVKATSNHKFPTSRGRLSLSEIAVGDRLYLQSGKGGFGNFGNYNQGLILGLITGDGTFDQDSAYIDIWEPDFDQCDYIKDVVNKEIKNIETKHKLRSDYGEIDWYNQTSTENCKKKRMGSVRLYKLLQSMGINDPKECKKAVAECVYKGSENFVKGFLSGLFFADGSVQMSGHKKKSTLSYRLTQANESYLKDIQIILSNFGIISRLYKRREAGKRLMPDGKGGRKSYNCKAVFELILSRPNCITFDEEIGLIGYKKQLSETYFKARGKECKKPERFISKVTSIKYCGNEDVYCLKQEDTNTVIANGCVSGQCVEIGMYPVCDETSEYGWQGCNLSTINVAKVKTLEDFMESARAAAIIGTLQAGFTDFSYFTDVSKRIFEKEALLGVSMTGIMEKPEICIDPKNQREVAKFIIDTNKEIAELIGINQAARVTCIKPEGSASCLLGTSSGIHPHHAKRYIRRIQANRIEPIYQKFNKINPNACERSVWSSNSEVELINFCIEVPNGSRQRIKLEHLNY